ncbi:DegT/DnrJ/EryC1/StrS family aminotransferase [Schaedlerella arabinosiphila]|uniref:DegT/DnrJ/EryC1/StrS family aminotransferase n=1 Tax=Schaedlerella arabinosiphila TaxID=2044587 RepID=A0A9X5H5K7_9FIRM|nr:DegT/DnrJ/EryC1/StrS family aminotransferase [Schaedlerella arabinosiphila]KAI4443522.1 putative pyridoxal phosphate-dependent aminotransferase EpsN [Schaedlerella arabinosiphila]NDO68170.1 DegT/DnrJ/EryC1/StrS family aminotransferase [Schaedlerella arabinosiphila]
MHDFLNDKRFEGIQPIDPKKALLASATPHEEEEIRYIRECYEKGWITTSGDNINAMEADIADYMSTDGNKKYVVALTNGTAALHLAVKLAAEKIYGTATGISTPAGKGAGGSLLGKKVFVTDMTFDASVNPVLYEGGEPVFIDSEYDTWNMDPVALKKAFEIYPDVKLVIFVHLYGVPGKIEECKKICERHGAILIEDAAESLGADVILSNRSVVPSGSIGDYAGISMNGNKILTGSSGGALVCPDKYSYDKAKKWSTQAREDAPWYEHEELGYNYRISNIIAGVIRGQWPHLNEHIEGKRKVFKQYREGLKDLPVTIHGGGNYWLSTILIEKDTMESFVRGDRESLYLPVAGKSCPSEIMEALGTFGAQCRPIWKPLHLQPMYRGDEFITVYGRTRGNSDAYIKHTKTPEVVTDIFMRGLCLPSDNKMTEDVQDVIIDIIHRCFR